MPLCFSCIFFFLDTGLQLESFNHVKCVCLPWLSSCYLPCLTSFNLFRVAKVICTLHQEWGHSHINHLSQFSVCTYWSCFLQLRVNMVLDVTTKGCICWMLLILGLKVAQITASGLHRTLVNKRKQTNKKNFKWEKKPPKQLLWRTIYQAAVTDFKGVPSPTPAHVLHILPCLTTSC